MNLRSLARAGWVGLAVLSVAGAAPAPSTPPGLPGWTLAWHDEFDGTALDRSKWAFDTGTGFLVPAADGHGTTVLAGWGNNELECYTDRPQNAYVAGGVLHVRAIKERVGGGQYTSARLRTGGKGKPALFTHRCGRFEFRAKMPVGQGYWPGLWLLPQDEAYGGWASSGEIDVLENKGRDPHLVQGTIHYGGGWPGNVWFGQEYRLPDQGTVADWHTYALEWDPGQMRWEVDGVVYATRSFWYSRAGARGPLNPWPAPFDRPFYVVMNLAVGGQFGGDPTPATAFPQEMQVDYVRVYDRAGGPGPVTPPGPGDVHDASKVVPPAGGH